VLARSSMAACGSCSCSTANAPYKRVRSEMIPLYLDRQVRHSYNVHTVSGACGGPRLPIHPHGGV
jgi:hypothetical protein